MDVTLDVSAVPPRPAGAGRYIIALAAELAVLLPDGLELVCQRGDVGRWRGIAPNQRIRAVMPRARAARLVAEQVKPALRLHRPKGTIWHGPHYTLPLAYTGGPRVVTVMDTSLLTHPDWHERSKALYFGRMIPLAARRADQVICISEQTRRELLQHVDLTPEQVCVTPLALDHAHFEARSAAADVPILALRDATGGDRPYVLVLGTAEPRKNLARVVQAFESLALEFPELVLAMAGQPGWKTADVRAVLENSPHRARVLELGYVADEALPGLLQGAVALCYPSLYEGFGLPVIEALACGTLVVTSSGSVMQEMAEENAIYVDPLSTESIGTGLRTALRMPADQRKAFVERGKRHSAGFQWRRTAELTVSAYERASRHWETRRHR